MLSFLWRKERRSKLLTVPSAFFRYRLKAESAFSIKILKASFNFYCNYFLVLTYTWRRLKCCNKSPLEQWRVCFFAPFFTQSYKFTWSIVSSRYSYRESFVSLTHFIYHIIYCWSDPSTKKIIYRHG